MFSIKVQSLFSILNDKRKKTKRQKNVLRVPIYLKK